MSVPTDAELRGLRIIALALTSGVALFLLFVLALGVAAGMIVMTASQIPGTGAERARDWIERRIRVADEEAALSSSGRET